MKGEIMIRELTEEESKAYAAIRSYKEAVDDVDEEVMKAIKKYPVFNSNHEGYAVILEEMDELWDEIKKKTPDKAKLKEEAIQTAAMCVRFIAELT